MLVAAIQEWVWRCQESASGCDLQVWTESPACRETPDSPGGFSSAYRIVTTIDPTVLSCHV